MNATGYKGRGGGANDIVGYGAGGNPDISQHGYGGGAGHATWGGDGGNLAKDGAGSHTTYDMPQLGTLFFGSGGGMAYDGPDITYPGANRGEAFS